MKARRTWHPSSHSPQIIAEYRAKLEEKVKEFLEDSTIEENRIAAEVTLYADKIAVDEEIVRLQSHISSMTDVLESDESVGRKLDFMAQEMNREAERRIIKPTQGMRIMILIGFGVFLKELVMPAMKICKNYGHLF